jgi:Mn-dependent DtxR family transcriptional regulator
MTVTLTDRQWNVLDATRTFAARRTDGKAWRDDVVAHMLAEHGVAAGVTKRTIAELQKHGMVDADKHWFTWLTEKGRAFLEDGNEDGR